MRLFLMAPFAALGIAYMTGAFYFCQQERWARTPPDNELEAAPSRLQHPEATLEVIDSAFASNNFSPDVLNFVNRSLEQVPSFYQGPFLLASYHANRIEAPFRTRQGYEEALERYPANGRLHLSCAQWLLGTRLLYPGFQVEGSTEEVSRLAEEHLKEALRLEPDLTQAGLVLLQRHRMAPDRWSELVPDEIAARRELFRALARAGHPQEALELLREMIEQNPEPELFREAAAWALRWGDPALALESALQWQEAALNQSLPEYSRATLQLARAHLSRGEKEAAYQVFRQAFKEIEARSSASSPSGLQLLCGMAYEYMRHGQTVMAESLFAEANTLAPYHVPASLGLARTYRRAGDRDAAIKQYQNVLQLDPENSAAEKELAPLIIQRELEGAER